MHLAIVDIVVGSEWTFTCFICFSCNAIILRSHLAFSYQSHMTALQNITWIRNIVSAIYQNSSWVLVMHQHGELQISYPGKSKAEGMTLKILLWPLINRSNYFQMAPIHSLTIEYLRKHCSMFPLHQVSWVCQNIPQVLAFASDDTKRTVRMIFIIIA